jgi:hypothetical protein
MRFVVLALVATVACPSFAHAQPCEIHVLRAPDAVRAAIDDAIRAEKRCATSLVVRVVPTDKGFYLFAESTDGRTFERVVGDVRAAAAQVARWSIPDRVVPAVTPSTAPSFAEPLPVLPADPLAQSRHAAAPSVASRDDAPVVTTSSSAKPVTTRDRRGRWLSLGGVGSPDVQGARLELDFLARAGWSLGLGLEASDMQMGVLEFQDVRAIATVGYTVGTGAWQLRTQLGIGMIRTELAGDLPPMGPFTTSGMFPTGEAAAQLTRTLGDSWAFAAGPLVTVYSQEYRTSGSDIMVARRDYDVAIFGALRRRL